MQGRRGPSTMCRRQTRMAQEVNVMKYVAIVILAFLTAAIPARASSDPMPSTALVVRIPDGGTVQIGCFPPIIVLAQPQRPRR
jgi:hypothetical protein